jgi:hypothetical protein
LSFEPGLSVAERKQLALFQKSASWSALEPSAIDSCDVDEAKGEFSARICPRVSGIYSARITSMEMSKR